jgi:glutaredoxin-related protein
MIIIYALEGCPYCNNAFRILTNNKIKFNAIYPENIEEKELFKKQNRMNTFPQIFLEINKDNYMKIGGCDNLIELTNICNNIKNSNTSLDSIYYMYQLLNSK